MASQSRDCIKCGQRFWPLMPAEVRKPAQQAIGHTRNGAMTDASVIGRD